MRSRNFNPRQQNNGTGIFESSTTTLVQPNRRSSEEQSLYQNCFNSRKNTDKFSNSDSPILQGSFNGRRGGQLIYNFATHAQNIETTKRANRFHKTKQLVTQDNDVYVYATPKQAQTEGVKSLDLSMISQKSSNQVAKDDTQIYSNKKSQPKKFAIKLQKSQEEL